MLGRRRTITKESLCAHMRTIIADYQQLVNDSLAWNECHPDEAPLDCELDRQMVAKGKECLVSMDADDAEAVERTMDEMLAVGDRMCDEGASSE